VIAFLWETPQFILSKLVYTITVIGTWSRLAPIKHFKMGLFTLFSVKPGTRQASQTGAPGRALIAMLASQNRTADSGRYGVDLIYTRLYCRSRMAYRDFMIYIRFSHNTQKWPFLQTALGARKMLVVHRTVNFYNAVILSFFKEARKKIGK